MKTSTVVLLLAAIVASASARSAASECPPKYYKIGNVCGQCSANMATCTATADNVITPGECTTGNVISADGKSCVSGSDPNVDLSCAEALCVSQGAAGCPVCNDGYYALPAANSTTGYCQVCPGEGTASCSDATTITACKAGFFLTEGDSASCQACGTGCASCSSADSCDTCMENGYYTDASNACVACAEGCVTCTAESCSACAMEYVLGTDGVCVSKPGCEEGSEGKCTTCKDMYRLVSTDGSCKSCSSKVLTCDSSADGTTEVINMCKSNYIKKGSGSTAECVQVNTASIPCVEVDADGKCSKCAGAAYVLSSGACVLCSSVAAGCGGCTAGDATTAATCSACAAGYHGDGTNCAACVANCVECADGTTCTTCANGYYINDNNVCAACNSGLAGPVTLAAPNGLGSTDCTLNQANSCAVGFGLFTVNVCRACHPALNCAACTTRWDQCTSCVAARTLSSNACVVCDPNCNANACTTQGEGKCDQDATDVAATACATANYVLNKSTWTCELNTVLPDNCTTADAADNAKCGTCNAGFWNNAGVCAPCTSPCATCTGSATTCDTCVTGWGIDSGNANTCVQCTAASNCTNCDGATPAVCTACAAGKGIDAGNASVCVDCTAASNCSVCDGATPAVCTGCVDGRFIDAGNASVCTLCTAASNCVTCSAAVACTACAAGRYIATTANNGACDPCTSPCATCSNDSATHCDTCIDGYGIDPNNANTCIKVCATGERVNGTACEACSDPNCTTCTAAAATCTACKGVVGTSDWRLSTAGTTSCVDINALNCATPQASAELCTTCVTGYRTDANNLCVACIAGCNACADSTTCTTCNLVGFFKNADNTCTACITGCSACADATTCTTCATKYFKTADNICAECQANCNVCADANTCTTCASGYMKSVLPTDATETTYCEVCDSTCLECTFNATGKRSCTKCNADLAHHLNAEGGDKCQNKACRKSNGTGCTECNYGFKLVDQYSGCVDCIGDASCPVSSCGSATPGSTPGSGSGGNTTNTDSSASRYAANILILAVLAFLGLSLF